jgi:hypothetical protein
VAIETVGQDIYLVSECSEILITGLLSTINITCQLELSKDVLILDFELLPCSE